MPTAGVTDLNRDRFENEYLPSAFSPDVLAANERSYAGRLAACRMVVGPDEPTPTVVGMLVLSVRPRDYIPRGFVQFLRIRGADLADPIADEEAVDGDLFQIIRRLDEKMRAHVQVAVDVTSGPTEVRTPDYPVAALEQLARNAGMHRSYEGTNAPVRVTWFDDRIEIQSPGGPFDASSRT